MFLEHVNITVSDLDRSIAFYCDLLDLEVRWRGTAETSEGTVRASHIGDERHYLAMFETSRKIPAPQDYGVPGVNHFGFVVESLEAAKQRLAELGVSVPPESERHFEPGHRLYFRDPDDIEVELVGYDKN